MRNFKTKIITVFYVIGIYIILFAFIAEIIALFTHDIDLTIKSTEIIIITFIISIIVDQFDNN